MFGLLCFVLLAIIALLLAIAFFEAKIGIGWRLFYVGFAAIFALPLWLVGALWLRGVLYGASTCTLRTVPGVIGGWLKADITCKLPKNPEGPIRARLASGIYRNRIVWQMEEDVKALPVPVPGSDRSLVVVQLRIPAHEAQHPLDVPQDYETWWTLRISQEARPVPFRADFLVPVCSGAYAVPAEQLAPDRFE